MLQCRHMNRCPYIGRIFRDRRYPLDTLTDNEIIQRYRSNRGSRMHLINELDNQLSRDTKRSHSIPVHLQIMVALNYYAQGSFMNEIASYYIHKMSVSNIIRDVSYELPHISDRYVKFPRTNQEIQTVKQGSYNVCEIHFPNVLGALDDMLIPIKAPTVDEHLYICRKGFQELNVQAIAHANVTFSNIVAQWPGSTHDSYIWLNSNIRRKFENGIIQGYLLGDSGYGLQTYCLTPIGHP